MSSKKVQWVENIWQGYTKFSNVLRVIVNSSEMTEQLYVLSSRANCIEVMKVNKITIHRVVSLMARILGSNPRGVGSIPTRRAIFGEIKL